MLPSFGLFSTKNDIIQRLIYTLLNTKTVLFISMNHTSFITSVATRLLKISPDLFSKKNEKNPDKETKV